MRQEQKNLKWNGLRVLVTGAGGFIGSHLVEELVRLGAKVTAFVHYNSRNDWGLLEKAPSRVLNGLDIIAGDICDPHMLKDVCAKQKVVFHLAALIPIPYSYIAPASFLQTNAMGSLNLFKACMEAGVERVVHTSTSETYGTARYVPIDEEHPLQAQSPYSASKIAADKVAESFCRSFGAPITTIRPFNTFGPRQSARAVIPTIITQALSRGSISLGSLHPVRDFNFVRDTVRGFISVAESKETVGEVVNIGSGVGITIGDLVKLISAVTGRRLKVVMERARVRPSKSEVDRLICANDKAQKLCGWKPRIRLEDGLRKTAEYIEKNLNLYKTEVYNL